MSRLGTLHISTASSSLSPVSVSTYAIFIPPALTKINFFSSTCLDRFVRSRKTWPGTSGHGKFKRPFSTFNSKMNLFEPDDSKSSLLKDKVVVLTGGAQGIGEATVTRLYQAGAHVYFGDISVPHAEALVRSLGATKGGSIMFLRSDVTSSEDIYSLFRAAYDAHGHVDHAISCAGILERGKWIDPDLTIDTLKDHPVDEESRKVLDTNLWGSLLFARAAMVFLTNENKERADKSLTLMASVNSFRESPQLYMYSISKHGLLGFLRSSRCPFTTRDGVRLNAVCPGVTESAMTVKIVQTFKETPGMYWQPSDAVGKVIVALMAAGPGNGVGKDDKGIHGKAFYVEDSKAWEVEEGFQREMPNWMGEEPTMKMRANLEAIMKGALLKK